MRGIPARSNVLGRYRTLAFLSVLICLLSSAVTFAAEPKLVVFVGSDPADLAPFEHWLGREVDGVQVHTGRENWDDWSGSIPWAANRWKTVERPIYWTIPLIPKGASLADAAAGAFDARYRAAAEALVKAQPDGPIHFRLGWEFNGNWMPWAAKGQEKDYVAAFARVVDIFRTVSDRFRIEWVTGLGDHGMNPEDAYPGDDYVDVIGADFYFDPRYYGTDPAAAWKKMLNERYGLAWVRDFAAKHGKPAAYPEWGVTLDSSGPFIESAAEWFRATDTDYAGYWNSNAAFTGKLDDGRVPNAASAFRRAFGPRD